MALTYDSTLTLNNLPLDLDARDEVAGIELTSTRIYVLINNQAGGGSKISVHNRQTGDRVNSESFVYSTTQLSTDFCFAGDFLAVLVLLRSVSVWLTDIDIININGVKQSTIEIDYAGTSGWQIMHGVVYHPETQTYVLCLTLAALGRSAVYLASPSGELTGSSFLARTMLNPGAITWDGSQYYVSNHTVDRVTGNRTVSVEIYDSSFSFVEFQPLTDASDSVLPDTRIPAGDPFERFGVRYDSGQLAVLNGFNKVHFYGTFKSDATVLPEGFQSQQIFSDFDSAVNMHFVRSGDSLDIVSTQRALLKTATEYLGYVDVDQLQDQLSIVEIVPYRTVPKLAIDDWIFLVDPDSDDLPTALPSEAYQIKGISTVGLGRRQIFFCQFTDTS